jgi:hypothetical protein
MHKKILLLVIIIPFIGCTSPNMIMRSWVGHTENELYRHWGPPSKTIDNGSNGKIVVYVPDSSNKGVNRQRYVNASQPVEYLSPRNNQYKKIKSFYITPMGTIYAWKWE